MKIFLHSLYWSVLMVLSMTAGAFVFVHGCPDELTTNGLSLFHVLALVCCAFCAVHCLRRIAAQLRGYYSLPRG